MIELQTKHRKTVGSYLRGQSQCCVCIIFSIKLCAVAALPLRSITIIIGTFPATFEYI